MPPKIVDRRVQKTRKLLQDALIELVTEKSYEAVTIQDILDKANVGRSTFYAHFQDKDQLLHSILDRLDELFDQHKNQVMTAMENIDHKDLPPELSPTFSLFRFVGQNHPFFKAMLGNRGYGIFAKPVYDYVFAHVHGIFTNPSQANISAHQQESIQKLISRNKYDSLGSEIAAHYFVSALMGILVWWVGKDMPCTAEEVDGYFRELAMPGFMHVVAVNHES